ncbi:toll/interleukin-1 receptor domain-containing protein [Lysobacter sp. ESA13C]|uniref:toll/interleukin-1 receptor domain-containing protein n=1 Tax=Lysobacter sp. ESA13C TaxID=2862676 RepID=UPI001CBE81C1
MSPIFISHSSSDNAQAFALRDRLAVNGWSDVFLDLDPRRGLIAGERWQVGLPQAAHRCGALIFVISPTSAASRWCLTEFLLANSLGKRIFGVIVQPIDLSELPREMGRPF